MGVLPCSGVFTGNVYQSRAIVSSHARFRSSILVYASSKQNEGAMAKKSPKEAAEQQEQIVVRERKIYVPEPTRGDVFFEQEQKKAAAAELKKKNKDKLAKKKKVIKLKKPVEPCCYGCGAPLQHTREDSPGYLTEDIFTLKKKHRQLATALCTRCQLMSHGKLVPAVGGYGVYGKEKGFVTAEELRSQLAHIREERVLVVKLVDIVDFSGSFITRLRDLVGSNPIVLVATKVDLLPEGTNMATIGDWIIETTLKKKLNVISVHLTSAKSSLGIQNIVKEIQRERQGRDVYVLGAANVGKSAFISVLLREMAARDPCAAVAKRFKPVQSILPGTTVGPIAINAFSSGGSLYDTPGVHVHHRIETAVSPDDLPMLFPPRRLRGYIISPILERKGAESFYTEALRRATSVEKTEKNLQDLSGITIFWGAIARLDVIKAPLNVRLTLYGSSSLRVHKLPTSEADAFYASELGKSLVPPTGDDKALLWPGLEHNRKFSIAYDTSKPVCDIAISGLGWFSVEFVGKENIPEITGETALELQVHVPKGIEIFFRHPIPVGITGSEWYTFSDLNEEEEKTRPRLYYPVLRDATF